VLGEKLALESTIREGAHTCRFVVRSGDIPLTLAQREPSA
jgi:hypothetical protein